MKRKHDFIQIALAYRNAAHEVLLETFWPTRCVLCDHPGEVLCEECRRTLPYLDHWRRCPRCGAPLGTVQCTECNRTILKSRGIARLPYFSCVSVTVFNEKSARIITCYKDQNEQRLAKDIAALMYEVIPPEWLDLRSMSISYIPASAQAYRRRGFDHAEKLAEHLGKHSGLPCVPLFKRPHSKDQRQLNRKERITNMESRLHLLPATDITDSVLLVDDVYTTGATLCAASNALKKAGVQRVYCVTFTRVW